MRDSLRNRVRFLEQQVLEVNHPAIDQPGSVQNLIYKTDDPAIKWIETATSRIGDWRASERSVFMRWAITINALHVARDRYRDSPEILLTIDTLRTDAGRTERVHLAGWRGDEAARNHEATIPMMAAYAVQDMFGILEEIVLELYEIFVRGNPSILMRGDEYKPLRAAFRAKDDGEAEEAAFTAMWEERIAGWRRNRTFDGLHRVFGTFWAAAGLVRPSWYRLTDVDDWLRVMETIGEIRHLVTHGEDKVSKRLGDLCAGQPNLGMTFKEGERLEVTLQDLWIVEHFVDQLLNAINMSLIEKAGGPLAPPGRAKPDEGGKPAAKGDGRGAS
jgi:hypothetical protein